MVRFLRQTQIDKKKRKKERIFTCVVTKNVTKYKKTNQNNILGVYMQLPPQGKGKFCEAG